MKVKLLSDVLEDFKDRDIARLWHEGKRVKRLPSHLGGDELLDILRILNDIKHPLELRGLLSPKSKIRQIKRGKRKGQWKFNLDIAMNIQYFQPNNKREIPFTHPGMILNFCQGKKDISQQVAQKLSTYFKEKEVEIIEAKELEKNKSCQITLRVGYKELKEIFPNQ
ncbi:21030_t:CDS:2 [Entrophospora sp. SA101]|nr:9876_t:CDS:2 [Entrophospora sp. SA101]CAJ0746997.1 21030_t:CDS:2 [Entrophospora sp. SA101]